jgi:hypothetical protein
MLYLGSPTAPPPAPDPADQGLSPSALAKIARVQAEREAKAAMKLKIDPVILRLEGEGITRDDLISYFEREIMDDLNVDGICKDRDNLP